MAAASAIISRVADAVTSRCAVKRIGHEPAGIEARKRKEGNARGQKT